MFICIFHTESHSSLVKNICVLCANQSLCFYSLVSVGSDDYFKENATASLSWFQKAADKVCLQDGGEGETQGGM